jgi:threonine dehydrogenase-like Zn-dependent dehydrogenase
VAVVEPDRHRRELAESLGGTGLDPSCGSLAGAVSEALGGPATLTLDAVGSTGSLNTALEGTAAGGRVVLVGMNEQEVTLPAYAISTQERSIIGSFCYSPTDFTQTAAWVGGTDAPLDALIDGRVSLEEAPAMFSDLAARRVSHSKVLVYPGRR